MAYCQRLECNLVVAKCLSSVRRVQLYGDKVEVLVLPNRLRTSTVILFTSALLRGPGRFALCIVSTCSCNRESDREKGRVIGQSNTQGDVHQKSLG
jgi:hypothetical protein